MWERPMADDKRLFTGNRIIIDRYRDGTKIKSKQRPEIGVFIGDRADAWNMRSVLDEFGSPAIKAHLDERWGRATKPSEPYVD